MTTGASQADMTLIMVCESTRPRVSCETIVSAQRVVARHSDHEKLVDDDCSRELKTLRCWERSSVLEMSERLTKLTDELRELVSRIPQLASSTRELEDLITDLINRLQTKTPSEARVIERL